MKIYAVNDARLGLRTGFGGKIILRISKKGIWIDAKLEDLTFIAKAGNAETEMVSSDG